MNVVVVDNYDSFTYNLVEYLSAQPRDDHAPDVTVLKNTASLAAVRAADPDAVVISPGPGHPDTPRDVGVTTDVLRAVSPRVPTLGVCLGMEAAVHEYGGTVGRAAEPMHGKTTPVSHDETGIFADIQQDFPAARYHSLVCTSIPSCFAVTATTRDGLLPMAIRHHDHPLACVQFHPESVLTGVGHDVIGNFLDAAAAH
ncbi:anthranilate synthase component II [Halobacterium salinarum]|uniref:anthranilate synthase component II n=1 Tax=Halobacterium salinarum TaxID=2242 RepID=UPI002555C67B|nr:anthranilate synthase component II [Halobacterium salinarum]MDL0129954.1 anthranilate synthase component II [Halobacterium salinarum]MDL0134396.1 anthranilate synthase component II [Halobacterium salinarum]